MSIGFVNAGPYDGTGSINTIVNNAQTAGILWANSAGNNQKTHWSGTATQYRHERLRCVRHRQHSGYRTCVT